MPSLITRFRKSSLRCRLSRFDRRTARSPVVCVCLLPSPPPSRALGMPPPRRSRALRACMQFRCVLARSSSRACSAPRPCTGPRLRPLHLALAPRHVYYLCTLADALALAFALALACSHAPPPSPSSSHVACAFPFVPSPSPIRHQRTEYFVVPDTHG